MTGKERKRQIAESALDLLATDGVQGATNARIAQAAGITAAAMYRHFDDRNQVLLAALDSLYDRIRRLVLVERLAGVVEQIRNGGAIGEQEPQPGCGPSATCTRTSSLPSKAHSSIRSWSSSQPRGKPAFEKPKP